MAGLRRLLGKGYDPRSTAVAPSKRNGGCCCGDNKGQDEGEVAAGAGAGAECECNVFGCRATATCATSIGGPKAKAGRRRRKVYLHGRPVRLNNAVRGQVLRVPSERCLDPHTNGARPAIGGQHHNTSALGFEEVEAEDAHEGP